VRASASMASVSWISSPAPAAYFSRIAKISGCKMEPPVIERLEGASLAFGFSTILVMENAFPLLSLRPTTPYMWMRSRGTSSTAMTLALSSIRAKQVNLIDCDQCIRNPSIIL
jgi:hypothetical protein